MTLDQLYRAIEVIIYEHPSLAQAKIYGVFDEDRPDIEITQLIPVQEMALLRVRDCDGT